MNILICCSQPTSFEYFIHWFTLGSDYDVGITVYKENAALMMSCIIQILGILKMAIWISKVLVCFWLILIVCLGNVCHLTTILSIMNQTPGALYVINSHDATNKMSLEHWIVVEAADPCIPFRHTRSSHKSSFVAINCPILRWLQISIN